jgi:predicted transcriptional regulator
MTRTVISLPDDQKAWLDRLARQQGVPMTRIVQRAVALLRAQMEAENPSFDALLDATSGTWERGDGLAWQRALRDEW